MTLPCWLKNGNHTDWCLNKINKASLKRIGTKVWPASVTGEKFFIASFVATFELAFSNKGKSKTEWVMLLSHDVMAAILMYQNNERWPCWRPLCLWDWFLLFCKKFLSFLRKLLILDILAAKNLSCLLDKSRVQCEPKHGTLQYTAFSFWLMCLVLCPEHSCLTKLEINPLSPNSNQHPFSPNNVHRLSRD